MAPIPLSDLTIAVHTHWVVKAKIAEAAAKAEVRDAMDSARKAGIPPRVISRALRLMDRREQALDDQAAQIIRAVEAVPIADVVVGAFSSTGANCTLSATTNGEGLADGQ